MSLGMDFYKGIKSSEKRFVISPISGHDLIFQDEKLLCDEVNDFVLKNR
jgi:hypothetical protein